MGVYLGRNAVEVYGGGVKVKPEEEKTVTASTSTIEVTPTSGKTLKKVTVNPTPSEEKTVTPSASQQTVSPSAGKMLSKVTVNGDADLIPANIRQGVNIFGVDGKTSVIDTEDIAMLKADKNFNNLIDSTIGDAIRNKNGSTSKLTLDGMVTAINDIAGIPEPIQEITTGSYTVTSDASYWEKIIPHGLGGKAKGVIFWQETLPSSKNCNVTLFGFTSGNYESRSLTGNNVYNQGVYYAGIRHYGTVLGGNDYGIQVGYSSSQFKALGWMIYAKETYKWIAWR